MSKKEEEKIVFFEDLKGIDAKKLLQNEWVPLYKAFPFIKEEEDMQVNTNVDLLATTPEGAIKKCFQEIDPDDLVNELFEGMHTFEFLDAFKDVFSKKGKKKKEEDNDPVLKETLVKVNKLLVPFAVINVKSKDLKEQPLMDEGDVYQKEEVFSITLEGKSVKIDLVEKRLKSFNLKIKQNSRVVANIVFEEK